MGKVKSDFVQTELQIAKYHQSILEYVKDRLKEVKDLASKVLADLEKTIIEEIETDGKVKKATEERITRIDDIVGTTASEEGNVALIKARRELRYVVNPPWPWNFPNPIKISTYFMFYRDAFEEAIGYHGRKWETFLMEQSKESLSRRMSDVLEYSNKLENAIGDLSKMG